MCALQTRWDDRAVHGTLVVDCNALGLFLTAFVKIEPHVFTHPATSVGVRHAVIQVPGTHAVRDEKRTLAARVIHVFLRTIPTMPDKGTHVTVHRRRVHRLTSLLLEQKPLLQTRLHGEHIVTVASKHRILQAS